MDTTIDAKLRQYTAFWTLESTNEPLIGCTVERIILSEDYAGGAAGLEEIQPEDIIPEQYASFFERLFDTHSRVRSDAIWVASPLPSFPWLEAVFGCSIFRSDNEFWAKAPQQQVALSSLHASSEWIACFLRFTEFLCRLSNNRFPVGLPIFRGALDILLSVRGYAAGLLESVDRPEDVASFYRFYVDTVGDMIDRYYSTVSDYYRGYSIGPFHVWSPGKCIRVQQDAGALISEQQYREQVLPFDSSLCSRYPYSLFHLHSTYLHILPAILDIDALKVVQVGMDIDGPPVSAVVDKLKKIQDSKKALLIKGRITMDDLSLLAEHLRATGLYILVVSSSVIEAEKVFTYAKKLNWKQ